jgi:hypothetical protein
MTRPLAALLCTLLACLAVPAAAQADDYVSTFSLAPQDTAAGQHSQVDLHAEFDSADPVRDITIHLPVGLLGNPSAVPACSQEAFAADTCAPASRVGTTSVTTLTTILLAPTTVTASGYLYNVKPSAGEPARLGAIVTADMPVIGGMAKIILPVAVGLRPDGGLDTRIKDIPAQVMGLDSTVTGMDLHLGDVAPAFMSNPTSCTKATTALDITTRANVVHRATASFTPTKCGALGFTPTLSASIDRRGPKAEPSNAELRTLITVPAGQAASRTTTVTLPKQLIVDGSKLAIACSTVQAAANACPPETRVGSVRADTPLLPFALTGAAYVVRAPDELVPSVRLVFDPPVPLRLTGTMQVGPPLAVTFDGIPDVPLARLALTFTGGGPLKLAGDPCTGSVLRMRGALAAHNGANAAVAAPVRVRGCVPRARVALTRGSVPRLRLTVQHGRDAARLRRVVLRLPRGMRARPPRRGRGRVHVLAGGKAVRSRAVRVTRRTLTIALPRARSGVTVTLARGALRGRPRGKFTVTAVTTDGRRSTMRLRAARLR